jgi:hypothetical protein
VTEQQFPNHLGTHPQVRIALLANTSPARGVHADPAGFVTVMGGPVAV